MTTTLLVRRELPSDQSAVRGVHDAAFGDGGAPTWESRLVDDLRESENWVPALSIVAVVDGGVVGHVLATRGELRRSGAVVPVRAVGLAPIGVLPGQQRGGIGSALMQAVLGAAQALDIELVCLLGSPDYYSRFGFVIASTVGIAPPVPGWAPHFQARLLCDAHAAVDGSSFHYDAAFDREP